MRKWEGTIKAMAALVAIVAIAIGTHSYGTPSFGGGCPRKGIQCPMVYDPVTCSNGVTYSNSCVAYVNCATGCVPAGGF